MSTLARDFVEFFKRRYSRDRAQIGGRGGTSGGSSDEGEDAAGTGDDGAKIGKNSGGIKSAQTLYSEPNCRRNNSEKPPTVTGIGKSITVPTYGIAAMQQVAHVTAQAIMHIATAKSRRNNT